MFPDAGGPILSQHESSIVLDAAKGTSFFEINVWGMLFYGAHLRMEAQGMQGINASAFVGYILFSPDMRQRCFSRSDGRGSWMSR